MSSSGDGAARRRAATRVWGWLLLAAVIVLAWPARWGGHLGLTVVHGASMAPAYTTGDLVVTWRGDPRVDDVVVYRADGALIVHRVIGGGPVEGWVLRGDGNDWDDPYRPTRADVLGTVVLHVPQARAVGAVLASPWVWASMASIGAGLLVWPAARPSGEYPGVDGSPRRAGVRTGAVGVVLLLGVTTAAGLRVTDIGDVASGAAPVIGCVAEVEIHHRLGAYDGRLRADAVTVDATGSCVEATVQVLALDQDGRPLPVTFDPGPLQPGFPTVLPADAPYDPTTVRTWVVALA